MPGPGGPGGRGPMGGPGGRGPMGGPGGFGGGFGGGRGFMPPPPPRRGFYGRGGCCLPGCLMYIAGTVGIIALIVSAIASLF